MGPCPKTQPKSCPRAAVVVHISVSVSSHALAPAGVKGFVKRLGSGQMGCTRMLPTASSRRTGKRRWDEVM